MRADRSDHLVFHSLVVCYDASSSVATFPSEPPPSLKHNRTGFELKKCLWDRCINSCSITTTNESTPTTLTTALRKVQTMMSAAIELFRGLVLNYTQLSEAVDTHRDVKPNTVSQKTRNTAISIGAGRVPQTPTQPVARDSSRSPEARCSITSCSWAVRDVGLAGNREFVVEYSQEPYALSFVVLPKMGPSLHPRADGVRNYF